jgi:integrase
MPLNKFSIADVRTIVRDGRKGLYADGGGLWLQITASGSASWIFRYQGSNGLRRYMGLGPLHTVTLAEARDAASLARKAVFAGQDPIGRRVVEAVTFDQCAKEALDDRVANKKSTVGWQTVLNHASPFIGTMSVAAITPEDVLRALKPMWLTQTATANKLRRYIEAVLSYATHIKKLRTGENPASWSVLSVSLQSAKKLLEEQVEHYASMAPEELPEFMRALTAVDGIAARALEFLILTASRTGDIIGQKEKPHEPAKPPMRWADVDLDRALWTIPKSKGDTINFQVPLSEAAVALLRALPRKGEYVFPMGKDHMRLALVALRPDVQVHGFRSTFSGWAKNCEFTPDLVEVALKHKVHKTAVQKAYSEHVTYLAPRARMMELWGQFACGREEAKVVHLARA